MFHHEIPSRMSKFEPYLSHKNDQIKQELIDEYQTQFHDAADDSQEKKTDRIAREHISFLNQTATLLRKRLIDKDMLLGLVGAGLEADYPVLEVVLKAHRQAHFHELYGGIEYVFGEYERWKGISRW